MQASPSSIDAHAHKRRDAGLAWLLSVVVLLATSCATVRPEEKEHLAEPAMSFSQGGMAQAHEEHVLQNREGSYGGGSVKGGGCGRGPPA